MDVELFKKKFEKYFFYGMDGKSDVINYIILKEIKKMLNKEKPYSRENTIEEIKLLVKQLYRFVYLNEPRLKPIYTYRAEEDDDEIYQLIEQHIEELKTKAIITGGIENCDNSLNSKFYITGGRNHEQYPGKTFYRDLKQNIWIVQDVVPILRELCRLEQENKEQYYALFLDTKYNRTKNAINQLVREQEYIKGIDNAQNVQNLKRLEEIEQILNSLPNQLQEIKAVFAKFMNRVKIPKQDILGELQDDIPDEVREYIERNCSNYYTISSLKQEAQNFTYKSNLNRKLQEVKQFQETYGDEEVCH